MLGVVIKEVTPFPHGRARRWAEGGLGKAVPFRTVLSLYRHHRFSTAQPEWRLPGLPLLSKPMEVTPSKYKRPGFWVNPSTSADQKHRAQGLEMQMCMCT